MAGQRMAATEVGHPAPARDALPLWLLLFVLTGAPLAWAAHFLANVAIAASRCGASAWAWPAIVVIDAAAAGVALVALVLAWSAWRKTAHEKAQAGGGQPGHAAQVGEGRTRFMALGGMLMSVMFLAAILFDAYAAVSGPSCG